MERDDLSRKTGMKWEPAEIQETVWSLVKALYEKRKSPTGSGSTIQALYLTLSQNEIANVPDFGSLIGTFLTAGTDSILGKLVENVL